jgi:hypothetical protein
LRLGKLHATSNPPLSEKMHPPIVKKMHPPNPKKCTPPLRKNALPPHIKKTHSKIPRRSGWGILLWILGCGLWAEVGWPGRLSVCAGGRRLAVGSGLAMSCGILRVSWRAARAMAGYWWPERVVWLILGLLGTLLFLGSCP